uniref:Uncharacterized protein n=1 Tax=Arundo donax TaxID=35708 RepID=A0A0A9BF52_ARUDO
MVLGFKSGFKKLQSVLRMHVCRLFNFAPE